MKKPFMIVLLLATVILIMGGCSEKKVTNDYFNKILVEVTTSPGKAEQYKDEIDVRDERDMQVVIHEMANTLIIAEDGKIRGKKKSLLNRVII
ncbi:MAG: hypothetical protein K0S24_3227 [Sphingobacterium sp.]|nr:hypothetical protein [Sphingobacterium sp.]